MSVQTNIMAHTSRSLSHDHHDSLLSGMDALHLHTNQNPLEELARLTLAERIRILHGASQPPRTSRFLREAPNVVVAPSQPPRPRPTNPFERTLIQTSSSASERNNAEAPQPQPQPPPQPQPEQEAEQERAAPALDLEGEPPNAIDLQHRPPPLESEDMTEDISCKICSEQKSDTLLEPCNHLAMCRWCVVALWNDYVSRAIEEPHKNPQFRCPICREKITATRRVHLV